MSGIKFPYYLPGKYDKTNNSAEPYIRVKETETECKNGTRTFRNYRNR